MPKKFLLILLVCFLSACGFRTPQLSDLAPPMRTLYFNADNPNGTLATEVARRLSAMGVKLVNSPSEAPIELHLTKPTFTQTQPVIFYSSYAVNFSYSLNAHYDLRWTKNQKVIASGPLVASQTIIHNANQAYTSGADVLMRSQLTQTMAGNLLFNLTNNGTKNAVERSRSK